MGNLKHSKETKGISAFSKSYLVLYNGIQTLGWSYLLYKTCRILIQNGSPLGLWKACNVSILSFQSLAALEVLHCLIGIVPSSAIITFVQVFSRVFQVWGIMYSIEKVHDTPVLALTFLAWGITEVIRYSFYCANLLGKSFYFLKWCRYTFFMLLYPAGVIGEIGNMLLALDTIKTTKMYSLALPNAYNFSFNFYYANIFLMLTYIPLFPQLFMHMLSQRKKVLGKQTQKAEKDKHH